MCTRNSNTSAKTMMECILILMPFTKEAASLHVKPEKHKLHLSASSLTSKTRHFDALTHNYTSVLRILRSSKDIKNTLNQFMHLVRLM